jgi:hypothetical protein
MKSVFPDLTRRLTLGFATVLLLGATAQAEITLYDHDEWKFLTSGFVEADTMVDSTRSFREVTANAPVERNDGAKGSTLANGSNGRTQFSIRNSRLAFTVLAPETDGWKSKGYFEFDLLGYDPAPTSNGTSSNSESSFYNNPTMRIRHLYFQTESNGWQLLAGQYWMLFGWQPYYFMTSVNYSPLAGMTYNRTQQLRLTKKTALSDELGLESAVALLRPPQADSQMPDLQAGARLTYSGLSAGFTGSPTAKRKAQPASIGISGAVRQFEMMDPGATNDNNRYLGEAMAVNLLIPVIPSSDGKSVSGTLALVGEFTTGKGYGDQFANWTGNMASPLGAATSLPAGVTYKGQNLDAGLGDYDGNQQFQLVQLQSMNLHLQYHLPNELPYWFDIGAAQLASNNMSSFTNSTSGGISNLTGAAKFAYDRERQAFVNVFREFSDHLRAGLEYSWLETRYSDGAIAKNNRYQVSGWFTF